MDLLGIDIGGSGIKGALVNAETGALVADRLRIPTPKPATPKAVSQVVAQLTQHFDYQGPIGCAFPARMKGGVAQIATNVDKAWIGTNAEALFAKATGCPVVVLNDADAAGVAEVTFGAGRDRNDLVLMLTFGTGIGSALFADQRLIPNTELGHLHLPSGQHAESYAADRARKEEDLSWSDWAKRVQAYLTHVEFLLDPDLIVMGGGVSKPKRTAKYLHLLDTKAELVPAQLQNEAGIVGAAYYAFAQQQA
ncbi:MAG: ROK family protein [Bacteroidota bacterium]